MQSSLHSHLISLAEKYERPEFIQGDPSWFMHQIEGESNKEILAFIASAISYGSRKQFLPKIESLMIKGDYKEWLLSGTYEEIVPRTDDCFYRLYTKSMMNDFLKALAQMIEEYGSMKGFIVSIKNENKNENKNKKEDQNKKRNWNGKICALDAVKAITSWFATHGSIGIIPKDASSSCKRICMFLRWMVRDNSPVDLGLWSDLIDKKTLIIPMDTHVLQEATKLGIITSKSTSMSAAIKLSNKLKEFWPDDPIKGDFALFGLGVDEST